jgi:hypothetical protein
MTEEEAVWYLPGRDQQPTGPFAAADVLERCHEGTVTGATLCWCEGMDGWRPLAEVEPFQEALTGAPGAAGQGLDDLGRAFSKAVSLTRKKAKVVSLKVSISRHERRKQQLLSELGELVYKHESDIELLAQEPYVQKLEQVRAEDTAIESLHRDIERIEGSGHADQQDDNQ